VQRRHVTLQTMTAASAVCHITIAPGTNFSDPLGQFFLVLYTAGMRESVAYGALC
jgi:hypothetical protein